MKFVCPSLALVLLLVLANPACAVRQIVKAPVTVYIAGNKTTVVAFLPPSLRNPREMVASQAQKRVKSAIQNTKRCLGEGYASYTVVFAERIVVRSRGSKETFELGRTPLVGGLLLRPGANARILFAGGGPESLEQLLPSAASEYFGKACIG
jgi:hypothetical protein